MRLDLPHPSAAGGTVPVVANPLKMSATPPGYRYSRDAGPAHRRVLAELLELDERSRAAARRRDRLTLASRRKKRRSSSADRLAAMPP